MFENENKEFSEHLVTINRVAKVVKGGRRFGFAAIMIVGDNKGRVGYGTGKAKEVPEAVRKATEDAKTKMIRVHLKDNRTLHHDIVGRFGAGKVILRSASPGTGIIAGGPMRALFESLGIKDVVAKSTGSSNPHNMIKATFDGVSKDQNRLKVLRQKEQKKYLKLQRQRLHKFKMKINEFKSTLMSNKKRKRVGRGAGSGTR